MIKSKPCKFIFDNGKTCGSIYHTKMYHKPRKAIKRSTKRIPRESKKTRLKRLETRRLWFEENPPNSNGEWICYLQIAPDCPKVVDSQTIDLEHDLSKVRRPDLKYNISNIKPACNPCNKLKGSLSAAEAKRKYA